MAKGRRSYVILRHDGLLLRTRPVTEEEAERLYREAYYRVKNRDLRARYLAEQGNVLDLGKYTGQTKTPGPGFYPTGIYGSPSELVKGLAGSSSYKQKNFKGSAAGLDEIVKEFLRRPVRPAPFNGLQAVRYYEMGREHFMRLVICCGKFIERTTPKAKWFAYVSRSYDLYGVSVFRDSLWMWRQFAITYEQVAVEAAVVRRDATDREIIDAVLNDDAVVEMINWYADPFNEVINKSEERMRREGYEDVVEKAKLLMAASLLLNG